MALPLSLSTRIGRHMALVFVVSALIPLAVVAVYGAYQVRSELEAQATARLEQSVRSVGEGILDQLDRARNTLGEIAGVIDDVGPVAIERMRTKSHGTFASAAETHQGIVRPLWGAAPPNELAIPPPAQIASLSVIGAVPRVWISVSSKAGRMWGELEPAYLFRRATDRARISSSHVELCVRADGVPAPLLCSTADSLPGRLRASWQLFLGYEYAAPSWRIAAAESRAAVFEPIAAFQRTFAWSMAAIVGVVVLLSSVLVRRSLSPVEELSAGTKRIAQRDFSTPVNVSSGDEFQQLADSFNAMGTELERQFRLADSLNVIDAAALGSRRADDIAIATAQRLTDLLAVEVVATYEVGDEPAAPWRRLGERVTHAWVDDIPSLPDPTDRARLEAARNEWGRVDSVPACYRGTTDDSTVVFPLMSLRDIIGAVILNKAGPWTVEELGIAKRLCSQLALGLSNTRLIERLQSFSYGAITAFGRTVDASSPWTAGHSERVTSLSLRIGSFLELSGHDQDLLHRGGLLHDVGKIGVPTTILDKPGSLTAAELDIVRAHPELGAKILAPLKAFASMIPIVLHHHERFDGNGYPSRLAGTAIPYLARLLAVADVYDALVSDRPYREGLGRERAIAMIREGSGSQFDPTTVTAFLAVMTSEGDSARFMLAPLDRVTAVA